ncbi:MAG: DUF5654 family protein [Bacilli bacterium]|jgi:Zn-dependent protease with chaperone function
MSDREVKRKKNRDEFKVELLQSFAALITAAFGLVAALAWNEAIKTTINEFLGTEHGGIIALYVYAIIVTVIAVLFTLWIARATKKAKSLIVDDDEEEE